MGIERPIKRINCHLYEDTLPTIDRFAKAMGVTRAAVIRDLLDQAKPTLEVLTERLSEVRDNPDPGLLVRAEAIAKTLDSNVKKGVAML